MTKLKNRNPCIYPVRLFHLTLEVPPSPRRARSLCGYSLREGARFTPVENHIEECGIRQWFIRPYRVGSFIRTRNRNAFQSVEREEYWENLCPECLEHPDYVLTLLADLP